MHTHKTDPHRHSNVYVRIQTHTHTHIHTPAEVRPDRPALWFALALLTGVMTRDSMPVRGL